MRYTGWVFAQELQFSISLQVDFGPPGWVFDSVGFLLHYLENKMSEQSGAPKWDFGTIFLYWKIFSR